MSGSIDEYTRAKRSGAYTHPESKKIYDEGPENPDATKTTAGRIEQAQTITDLLNKKKPSKMRTIISWAILAIVILLGWQYCSKNPKQVEEVKNTITDSIKETDLFSETKEIFVESLPVPQYVEAQSLALEKLKVWERITKEAIRKFYATPIQPGYKRTLCIVIDGDQSCKSLSRKGAIIIKQP